jgi:hypothetical protein
MAGRAAACSQVSGPLSGIQSDQDSTNEYKNDTSNLGVGLCKMHKTHQVVVEGKRKQSGANRNATKPCFPHRHPLAVAAVLRMLRERLYVPWWHTLAATLVLPLRLKCGAVLRALVCYASVLRRQGVSRQFGNTHTPLFPTVFSRARAQFRFRERSAVENSPPRGSGCGRRGARRGRYSGPCPIAYCRSS